MNPVPPPLQVRGVVKTFRQGPATIQALAGVNLEVAPGEFIAIMGASGSGKSTLLHAVAGLTHLDAGQILVNGQDLAALSDARLTRFRRRHVGLVFQAFNLVPVLSAEDNVRLPAEALPDLDGRVAALLDRLGMAARRTHKPDALSGGEQQRIAIARALVTDPDLLLADEPTGSLDEATSDEVLQLLLDLLADSPTSLLMVTHSQRVASRLGQIVLLHGGRLADPDGH